MCRGEEFLTDPRVHVELLPQLPRQARFERLGAVAFAAGEFPVAFQVHAGLAPGDEQPAVALDDRGGHHDSRHRRSVPFVSFVSFVSFVRERQLALIGQTRHFGLRATQTIAPKFTGRFNKGVDYVGDVAQFAREFREDIAAIAFAVQKYGLPANLKLSVHSGSDKFSIYKSIHDAVTSTGAGVHLKTAGTTWLEEIIGLAIEEFDVGRLLSDPEAQRIVVEALLEIRIVEAGLGQGLDLADGGEVVDIVARQAAAVDAERVDVEFAAGPADQFLEVAVDGEIKPAEMDGAAARSSRDIGDVVADPDGAEIQPLGREPVMPFVEPFRGQPFGGIFVLGAGVCACARRGAHSARRCHCQSA